MKNDVAIFLPTRKGSERVKDKNTKPFGSYENGLLELKLKQLLQIDNAKIYLSSNDPVSLDIAKKTKHTGNLIIIERPEELCQSGTPLSELINYVPEIISEKHILWTHVTSPFIDATAYQKAIAAYYNKPKKNDSLMSVSKVQEFLWSDKTNGFVNFKRTLGAWPRTQDLEPLYAVNSAIFLAPRSVYLKGDRIGQQPLLYELSKVESLDIDWEEDFNIAQDLYKTHEG
jgi:N-acylneuraminate cytidylyltransferase